MDTLREDLAALVHEQWSGWQRYFLGKGYHMADGSYVLPAGYVPALEALANTPYAELDEAQKDNDRAEADRVLAVCAAHRAARGLR